MKKTALVLGTGNWGTTVAHLLAQAGTSTVLWGRNKEIVHEINQRHTNAKSAKNLKISPAVRATTELGEAANTAELIFIAVPSKVFREVSCQLGNFVRGDQLLISCTKGIETKSCKLMTEILMDETCCKKVGALSGPNIAAEIIHGDPSGAVIASSYQEVIEKVMMALQQPLFKVYGNKDVKGVEIGGALKNIVAIASGMAAGLGFENNSRAFLITRGILEISRYGAFFGAHPETFLGLSGIGDLIATCYSAHSRNNTFGRLIASGKKMEEVLKEIQMVVEGIYATEAVYELSQKFNIFMPITTGVHRLIFEGAGIQDVIRDLMTVRTKYEGEEDHRRLSDIQHMLINKYPIPEYSL